MKITFILPGGGRSGGVRSTVNLANHLILRGFRSKFLVRYQKSSLNKILKNYYLKTLYRNKMDWLDDFTGEIEYFESSKDIKIDNDEILVGVGLWSSQYLSNFSESIPRLQFFRGHTSWDVQTATDVFKLPINKVVVSSYLVPFIEKSSPCKVLEVIPNGIDHNLYYPPFSEKDRKYIGSIYSRGPSKGMNTLSEVLKGVQRIRPDVHVELFGSSKRTHEFYKYNYSRLPSIEKSREIYSKSIIWLVTSDAEGFSLPVLEAMCCGAVVISTSCGGPLDIIEDNRTGFLVDVGNAAQFLEKIEYVLHNKNIRDSLQSRAYETATKFTWDRSTDLFLKAIDKLNTGYA